MYAIISCTTIISGNREEKLKKNLEQSLRDATEKSVKIMDKKLEIEEKLKVAELSLASIKKVLDHKKKQLCLNIEVGSSAERI